MYFNQDDDERDPFELFGDDDRAESSTDAALESFEGRRDVDQTQVIEPLSTPNKVKTGFSWAGFAGGLAALVWIAGAIGGPLSYFGVEAVMAMDPAMQAGLIALAFGPALLFWVSASAAGEALKARRLAAELTRISFEQRAPAAGQIEAQRVTETVKTEIESLNDAVTAAFDRLAELESIAKRNAALFNDAVETSREHAAQMSYALKIERDAIVELNGDLKNQTEVVAHSVGRQVRLMREASKLVKTEVEAAEGALQAHVSSFSEAATEISERTAAFHHAADTASAASASLNSSMTEMLDGLAHATRLTETAKKATAEAVLAANETASAVRETTRSAVFEAKRAAQLIRAETVALQDAAAETLAKLQEAAQAARAASEESQAAADYHAAAIEKRVAGFSSSKTARAVERTPEPAMAEAATSLHAAASAAVTRGGSRPRVVEAAETQPKRVFKGFGGWGNFMPPREQDQVAANEDDSYELASFEASAPAIDPDTALKHGAIDLVTNAGVDLDDVLAAEDLARVARCSRDGASARRRAVIDAAPGAVTRIARHVRRNADAQELAAKFRARPDLAKSDKKSEGSELVRAYLLIDAALA